MAKFYQFPCGCAIPIDESLPPIHGHPSLIYPTEAEDLPAECETTWQMLSEGQTKGVFQLESPLGRQWTKKLKPGVPDASRGIEHLAALGALLRPGCLKSKSEDGLSMTEHYCRRKNGEEKITYFHPSLEPILNTTYGVLTFQEQAMAIAVALAGFTPQEADDLRKAIGKKKTDVMAKVKAMFIEKAAALGIVTREEAEEIFGWIEKSQRYSFNKCIAYDTKILRPNGGRFGSRSDYTVEDMYRIRNDISYAKATGHLSLYKKWKLKGNYGYGLSMNEDGRIRPNIIRDIQPSGIQTVYLIKLDNGASIRVTSKHKFPTPIGIKKAFQLTVGDRLYIKGGYEPSNFAEIGRFSDSSYAVIKTDKRVNGAYGESNWAYTNGSYTKYMEFKESTPNVCFICGVTGDESRIECHHINGDRTNSEPENLQKLCVPCHKLQQYKLGRTRKGEKGYPRLEATIVSIVEDGLKMTYDVTMDAPNHNFVTSDGIVTCNSHAVSYGLIGYVTAHMKAHFPLQFYTSFLYYAKEKQDPLMEIRQLVNDAKMSGIEVLPPRFEDLNANFTTDGVVITFGLADVKGIGHNYVKKMIDNMQIVEKQVGIPRMQWTWLDFLTYFAPVCSSNIVKRMIEVGSMGRYKMDRQRMLAEYETYNKLTEKEQHTLSCLRAGGYQREGTLFGEAGEVTNVADAIEMLLEQPKGVANKNRRDKVGTLLKMLRKPPRPLVDTSEWIATTEEECLGIPITCNRVDGMTNLQADTTCKEFREMKEAITFILAVDVQECRELQIQNGDNRGKKMAFLVVCDQSGSLEDVCMFSEAWEKYGNLIHPGTTVEIKGRRDPKRGSFIVEEVWRV